MTNLLSRSVFVIILLCVSKFCFSKKVDSLGLMYKHSITQEKIYIHYDKTNYILGDTLRFKAYLFTGPVRSKASTNFYLELINDNGAVISRITAPIFESTASGNIVLPVDSGSSHLYCRAYTASMLKDPGFIYFKELSVLNIKNADRVQEGAPFTISFLPEGGDWVDGLPSLMAFKVTDVHGLPVKASGCIKAQNDSIIAFATTHNGMGAFTILPHRGQKYIAVWTDGEGGQHSSPLPEPKPNGVVLHIADVPDGKKFFVLRSKQVDEADKTLTLIASVNGYIFYQSNINLTAKEGANGIIPVKGLPSGIINISVLNRQLKPLAERITFVNNHDYTFNADIALTVINNAKRGFNQIRLSVRDTLRANFSLSVTDADLENSLDYQDNIISQLLLTGDLKGKIVNPYYYFKNGSDTTAKCLDLVMLTHGWRKYNYDLRPVPGNNDNRFISIDGKLEGVNPKQISINSFANIIVTSADSSSVLLPVQISKDGTFKKDGLIFYGDAKLYFKFTDKALSSDRIVVAIKNGLV
jgi:hypothetical protein